MAKRDDKQRPKDKLQRTIMRNWILCGASLAAILILYAIAK